MPPCQRECRQTAVGSLPPPPPVRPPPLPSVASHSSTDTQTAGVASHGHHNSTTTKGTQLGSPLTHVATSGDNSLGVWRPATPTAATSHPALGHHTRRHTTHICTGHGMFVWQGRAPHPWPSAPSLPGWLPPTPHVCLQRSSGTAITASSWMAAGLRPGWVGTACGAPPADCGGTCVCECALT